MKITVRFLILLSVLVLTSQVSAKPLSSLSMKMNWADPFAYEQAVKITVDVFSQVSDDNVDFTLNLPDGVTLMEGDVAFQRKVVKGQALSFEFVVFVKSNTLGQIKLEASLGDATAVFFRAASQLSLGDRLKTQKVGSRNLTPPAFRNIERNGVKIREYPLP